MSALTIALEIISRNLKRKAPEVVSHLQPGLTRQEIDEKTKDLPGRLPEEVYELYQWHNGFSQSIGVEVSAFNGIEAGFCSLEESLDYLQKLKNSGCPSNLFLIFWCIHEGGGDYFAVILGRENFPIVHFQEDIEQRLRYGKYCIEQFLLENSPYPSLTHMIYALAECCQSNMRRDNYPNGYSQPYVNMNKFKKIPQKYSDKNLKIYTL